MRQSWLLTGALLLQVGLSSAADLRPALLILNNATNISDTAQRIETKGGRIRSQVPPSILTVDVPAGLNLQSVTGIKTVYQSAVPLSVLEPMGTIAVAAGMRWNRALLSNAAASGASSFSAMRALVSQKSLSVPADVRSVQDHSMVTLSWKAVASALYYEVEASLDSSFSNPYYASKTADLSLNLPAPEGNATIDVFYRVRGIDHGDDDHLRANSIYGPWSTVVPLRTQATSSGATGSAPVLSSPLKNYESTGFTLILEWLSNGATRYRVQVSPDKDFKKPFFDAVVAGREFICPSPSMQLEDSFYWRVKAWDDAKSDWSEIRKFTIGMPHTEQDTFVNPEAPQ